MPSTNSCNWINQPSSHHEPTHNTIEGHPVKRSKTPMGRASPKSFAGCTTVPPNSITALVPAVLLLTIHCSTWVEHEADTVKLQ